MKSSSRMAFWRSGLCGMSLAKTWTVLLGMSLLLVMIDLRVLWQQTDSSLDRETGTMQKRLRDGYSNGYDNRGAALPLRQAGGRQRHRSNGKTRSRGSAREAGPLDGGSRQMNIESLLAGIGGGGGGDGGGGDGGGGGGDGGGGEERGQEGEGGEAGPDVLKEAEKEEEKFLLGLRALKLKSHSNWIILDVTPGKCPEVPTALSGWKILATGDLPSVKGCSAPTCTYLSPDLGRPKDSASAPLPTSEQSPRGFRKNLAYLAAISQGAQQILDTDCATSLKTVTQTLRFSPNIDHGLMYNESFLFNPYAHFGAWAIVPRALSERARAQAGPNPWKYYVRDFAGNVLVKHGVSEASRDAFPLPKGEKLVATGGENVGTRFDRSNPAVFVGQRGFSPAVPTVSMYRHKGTWALLLPCHTPTLRCHVLRQLVQQRLLRELDAFSGFYQVPSTKENHEAEAASFDEDDIDVEKIVSQLNSWTCSTRYQFFDCVDMLTDHLYRRRTLNGEEFSLMKAWVNVMRKVRAAEPARVAVPWRGVRKTSEVLVTLSSMQVRLESGGEEEEKVLKTLFVDNLAHRCNVSRKKNDEWFPVAQWRKPVIEDIVLIILFNWNRFFWNNLPFTETMHRPFFKHIFYCVPNVEELLKDNKDDLLRHISFVEAFSDTWYFMYECVTIVAQMNLQGVRGYLQIGDDTLTNSWKYLKAPRDSIWMPRGFSTIRADQVKHRWDWYWWKKSRGRPAALHALADLEKLSGRTPQQLLQLDPNYNRLKTSKPPVRSFREMYQAGKAAFPPMRPFLPGSEVWENPTREEAARFMKNYYKANSMSGKLSHRALDFYYIPQVLAEGWVKFTRFFMRRNVLIEVAVPTIHYGLVPRSEVRYMVANSVWRGDRNSSYSFYDELIYFLHPFKMKSQIMESKESKYFFCKDYMNILFSKLRKSVKS
ncbi:hypothetical protein ACOMHN_016820 [Nucella lapillus]